MSKTTKTEKEEELLTLADRVIDSGQEDILMQNNLNFFKSIWDQEGSDELGK